MSLFCPYRVSTMWLGCCLSSSMTTREDLNEKQLFFSCSLVHTIPCLLDALPTGHLMQRAHGSDLARSAVVVSLGSQEVPQLVLICTLRRRIILSSFQSATSIRVFGYLSCHFHLRFAKVWFKTSVRNQIHAAISVGCLEVCTHGSSW